MVRKSLHAGRYKDCTPDITDTGAGKNYDGFRIFHTRKNGMVEHILNDGSIRPADREETERFMKDLTEAAVKDTKVSRYLGQFPGLRMEAVSPSAGGEGTKAGEAAQAGLPPTERAGA